MDGYIILDRKGKFKDLVYEEGMNYTLTKCMCKEKPRCFVKEDILEYLNRGVYLMKVTPIPTEEVVTSKRFPRYYRISSLRCGEKREITEEVILKLIKEGANVNPENYSLFKYAIAHNYKKVLRAIFKKDFCFYYKQFHIIDNLEEEKVLEIFKLAVDSGFDVNKDEGFLVNRFIERGNLEIVKFLVSKGADIHVEDEWPLRQAIEEGSLEIVKFLVSKGADIHAVNNFPLRRAIEEGFIEIVKFLVSQGANIHAEDNDAVKRAAFNGHLEVVKFLVSKGADVHVGNNRALRGASKNGHLEVVKFLKSVNKNFN